MNQLPLRPNVCLLIANREGKLFLGERAGQPGVWQLPQGGVEDGSSLEENVIRECCEELGVVPQVLTILHRFKAVHEYDWDAPPAYAFKKWRGQSQTFWLVRFLGGDDTITLDHHTPEFSAFKWCSVQQVRDLAEKKRLPGYEKVLAEFEEYLKLHPFA